MGGDAKGRDHAPIPFGGEPKRAVAEERFVAASPVSATVISWRASQATSYAGSSEHAKRLAELGDQLRRDNGQRGR
jgi:hypothetical protein